MLANKSLWSKKAKKQVSMNGGEYDDLFNAFLNKERRYLQNDMTL